MPNLRRKEPDDSHNINNEDEDSSDTTARTAAPKRQRVALACDFCRSAKAKCDGDRPSCGTCTAQKRACSYSQTSRKRGVQSGYLRSIELSISWLFEQYPGSEAALHRALVQSEGADRVRILAANSSTSSRLRRNWNKSRVYRDIGKLLAQDTTQMTIASDDEFETQTITGSSTDMRPPDSLDEGQPQESCPRLIPPVPPSPGSHYGPLSRLENKLSLPSNWKHLVDVYFSYTSPWFPIVDRESINSTASLYTHTGVIISGDFPYALHSQLWSILALASIQDAAASPVQENQHTSPTCIYNTSRDLCDAGSRNCEAPYISAILIQSLILLGQNNPKESWCLVGKAARLAIDGSKVEETNGPQNIQMNRLLAAAFILDTLTSALLGHPEAVSYGDFTIPPETFTNATDANQIWFRPLRHLQALHGATNSSDRVSPPPLSLFQQMFIFCQQWITKMRSRLLHGPQESSSTPEGLLRCLDPRFSFCNSLVPESGIAIVPSTCLLQCMFLTITLDMSSRPRSTLILTLLELVEVCVEQLGAFGLPPLITTLMGIVEKRGMEQRLPDEDKDRWRSLAKSLFRLWTMASPEPASSSLDKAPTGHEASSSSVDHIAYHQVATEVPNAASHAANLFLKRGTQGGPVLEGGQFAVSTNLPKLMNDYAPTLESQQQANKPTSSEIHQYLHKPNDLSQALTQEGVPCQQIDDNTILEELCCIDYADTAGADSQFMANLGFDPGYDLAELFVNEYNMSLS